MHNLDQCQRYQGNSFSWKCLKFTLQWNFIRKEEMRNKRCVIPNSVNGVEETVPKQNQDGEEIGLS